MKISEIKDIYNQSEESLRLLQSIVLCLPYCKEQVIADTVKKAAERAADLWKSVKVMCDYMIDDGSTDMTERLRIIKAEVIKIQDKVVKMEIAESEELIQNCQAIKNTIKDIPKWKPEPQHKKIKEPKTFRDRIAGNVDADELIAKLHTLMDNKSGKEAVVYLRVCMDEKKIKRYGTSYKIVINEFQIGCNSQYYYKCLNTVESIYSPKELEAAKKELGI